MTNQEILTKAIQKAEANGWNDSEWNKDALIYGSAARHTFAIIYRHDFCKALWGEPYFMNRQEFKEAGYRGSMGGGAIDLKKGAGWRYHLQEMVVAEDPIAYLGQNMPKGVE